MALQKPARGLADALGLFQGGEVPLEFLGNVQPTFDAMEFILEKRMYRRLVSGTGTQFVAFDFDEGFRYKFHWMGIEADHVTVAGQLFAMAPAIRDGIKVMGLSEEPPLTVTTSGITRLGINLNGLVSGEDLDAQAIGYSIGGSTANVDYEFFLSYSRWKI
jgi:hypothetical protein